MIPINLQLIAGRHPSAPPSAGLHHLRKYRRKLKILAVQSRDFHHGKVKGPPYVSIELRLQAESIGSYVRANVVGVSHENFSS